MTNNQPVKVGIVGVGYWGPKLARNFHDLPTAKLSMVADLSDSRLAEINKIYPEVEVTKNYSEMLGKVDAVIVATPVHAHFALAQQALQAGKHVMIEKPITSSLAQAKKLIEIADEKKLTLMVGHTFEYNPAVVAIREIIQSGELGQIYYMNSTRANLGLLQPDINVMWDLAPHDISILCYILGTNPESVSARGATYVNRSKNLAEVVYMTLIFPNNILVNSRLSWLDPVKQRRLTIVGSRKMLVYDDILDDKVIIYDKGVEVPPYSVTEEEFKASYRHGGETVYPLKWSEPLRAECADFVDAIITNNPPRSDGRDGARVLSILEMAQRSLENGAVALKIEYK